MFFLTIVHHYLLWHYSRAFLEIWHVWLNLLWFVVHFFSMGDLLKHWFAPYKRIVEDRGRAWNLEDFASYVIIGFFSRVVGGLIRTILLLIGTVCLLALFILGCATYLFWLAAPIVFVSLLATGIGLIVSTL
jgi:hypothetical protein